MKNVTKALAIASIILLGYSANAQRNDRVKGNGNITTVTVNTAPYDDIAVVGSMDVILRKGDEGNITITTDENVQQYVLVSSENGKLTITLENVKSLSTRKGIVINVPFEDLTSVSLTGSGDIVGNDSIKATNFDVQLVGSGDVSLAIDATTIDARLNGSGDVNLKGKTSNFDVKLSGSGDFNARSLKADDVEAYVSGSGDITLTVKNNLKARVNGSGDIEYDGAPDKVDSKVSGSGSISQH